MMPFIKAKVFKNNKEMLKMESHIQIFDTTLRDGEQTPGVNFTFDERLKIAKQLENGESMS